MRLPVRLRLTLWYSALLTSALVLFSATVYFVMNSALENGVDAGLRTRVHQIQREVHEQGGALSLPDREERSDMPSIPYILLNPDGHVINGKPSPAVARWLEGFRPRAATGISISSVEGIRLATVPIRRSGALAVWILAWESTQSLESARHTLLLVLLVGGLVLLMAAAGGGYVLAGRTLKPISLLTRTAASISASDLHRRVPVARTQDELSALALTFNGMIGRLETAVERERSFTSHASHELRAPLAVIRAEATLALDHPRRAEAYQAALQAIDEQAGEMEDLLASLLMLARVETSTEVGAEIVDIGELVQRAIRQAQSSQKLAQGAVNSRVEPELFTCGSPSLLQQAFRNVIENALKVTPAGGQVRVSAERQGERIVVTVQDDGPGIAPEHQFRIFEPFYQVDPARTPSGSHGLGLAICKRIVEAHGGEIVLQAVPGEGSTFRIALPAADTSAETRDKSAMHLHYRAGSASRSTG